MAVWSEEDIREEEQLEGHAKQPESRFAKLKRRFAKDKAERKFSKQYGGDTPASSTGGSRAAVYKGEMGSSHKRASRMQNGASASSGASESRKRSFSLRAAASKPAVIAGGAVAACLLLTCLFLYPTAQQYYQAVREHDRLQAEYAAIVERNENIQSEVNALSTPEGVEDRAHREYGWVMTGEKTANVRGLENVEDENGFAANIVPGSVPAPDTWYSKILDPFFGVE